uniref:Uncharacterized protein n=1 Tax=Glossina palpalis gambiensis TaxID=67801 RepID=A0A1B0AMR1_9MUSC
MLDHPSHTIVNILTTDFKELPQREKFGANASIFYYNPYPSPRYVLEYDVTISERRSNLYDTTSIGSLAPTKFTCDSKNFDFAITTTSMLPIATESNQQACSTDFIPCGA